jgi:hypothetical protein
VAELIAEGLTNHAIAQRLSVAPRTSREAARACLAPALEAFYQLPFERFERYCPCGSAAEVAAFLAPYAAAGCVDFNLIPQSPDRDQAIADVAAMKRLLAAR